MSYDRTKISCKKYNLDNVLYQDKIKGENHTMARIIEGNEMNLIGKKVRDLRKQKKLSQQALSDKLELMAIYICRGSISRIEDRQRTVTDIELYGLAKALDVSIEELFENEKIKKGRPLWTSLIFIRVLQAQRQSLDAALALL